MNSFRLREDCSEGQLLQQPVMSGGRGEVGGAQWLAVCPPPHLMQWFSRTLPHFAALVSHCPNEASDLSHASTPLTQRGLSYLPQPTCPHVRLVCSFKCLSCPFTFLSPRTPPSLRQGGSPSRFAHNRLLDGPIYIHTGAPHQATLRSEGSFGNQSHHKVSLLKTL